MILGKSPVWVILEKSFVLVMLGKFPVWVMLGEYRVQVYPVVVHKIVVQSMKCPSSTTLLRPW